MMADGRGLLTLRDERAATAGSRGFRSGSRTNEVLHMARLRKITIDAERASEGDEIRRECEVIRTIEADAADSPDVVGREVTGDD